MTFQHFPGRNNKNHKYLKTDGGSRDQESNFGTPRHEGILIITQHKRREERKRERKREKKRNGPREEESRRLLKCVA